MKGKTNKERSLLMLMISVIAVSAIGLIVLSQQDGPKANPNSVYAEYSFIPAYKGTADVSREAIETLESEARELVLACADESAVPDSRLGECIRLKLEEINSRHVQNGTLYWSSGKKCRAPSISTSDRKVVFCVNSSMDFYIGSGLVGWKRRNATFAFGLDFSQEAFERMSGKKPENCLGGTSYGECSGSFACMKPNPSEGSYHYAYYGLKQDCRGLDITSSSDDCACPESFRCADTGACTYTEERCSDGTPFSSCSPELKFCSSTGELIDDCVKCGCGEGYSCGTDGKCLKQPDCTYKGITVKSGVCLYDETADAKDLGLKCIGGAAVADEDCCIYKKGYRWKPDNNTCVRDDKHGAMIIIDTDSADPKVIEFALGLRDSLEFSVDKVVLTRTSAGDTLFTADEIDMLDGDLVLYIDSGTEGQVGYNIRGYGLALYLSESTGYRTSSSKGKLAGIDTPGAEISYSSISALFKGATYQAVQEYLDELSLPIVVLDPGAGLYFDSQDGFRYQNAFFRVSGGPVEMLDSVLENRDSGHQGWVAKDEITSDIAASAKSYLDAFNSIEKNFRVYSTRQLDKSAIYRLKLDGRELAEWKLGSYIYLNSGAMENAFESEDEIKTASGSQGLMLDSEARVKFANLLRYSYPGNIMIFVSIHTSANASAASSGPEFYYSSGQEKNIPGRGSSPEDYALCAFFVPGIAGYFESRGIGSSCSEEGCIIPDTSAGPAHPWLQSSEMPGCTLSLGSHRSPSALPVLANSDYRKEIGEAVGKAIAEYLG